MFQGVKRQKLKSKVKYQSLLHAARRWCGDVKQFLVTTLGGAASRTAYAAAYAALFASLLSSDQIW